MMHEEIHHFETGNDCGKISKGELRDQGFLIGALLMRCQYELFSKAKINHWDLFLETIVLHTGTKVHGCPKITIDFKVNPKMDHIPRWNK